MSSVIANQSKNKCVFILIKLSLLFALLILYNNNYNYNSLFVIQLSEEIRYILTNFEHAACLNLMLSQRFLFYDRSVQPFL